MDPSDPRLRDAFDPERFRAEGHRAIDLLADYLARALAGGPGLPVLPRRPPAELLAQWPAQFAAGPSGDDVAALLPRVLAGSTHLHHPRYVGHQVTSPLPVAALWEMVSALLNNGMAVYEMGPVGTAMEQSLLRWMAGLLGLGAAADGVLTSGGSLGNLTALLAARQAKAGFDLWGRGAHAGPPLALLACEQAHYSVRRAAAILGLGEAGVVPVPADERFRMRPDRLDQARRAALAAGRRPFAVVASAGSTATGAFDPLEAVADFCGEHGLWLHVDGAHGAAVALSERLRPLVAGIGRADSVVWDAHKMLLVPALATAVLFREGGRSHATFAQEASYLYAGDGADENALDLGTRTFECTKRMLGLALYTALRRHGTGFFAAYLERCVDLAASFAARLREAPDFELATEPACNIVCFRLTPAGVGRGPALDALQERLRRRILDGGGFYLVQTRLPAGVFLRTTLIHPLTGEADLDALLAAVRDAGRAEAA